MASQNEERLKQVLADTFGIDPVSVDDETSIDTLEAWDSLKHLNLVLAIEAEFDITFREEETVEILNFPMIKVVLQEHGIEF